MQCFEFAKPVKAVWHDGTRRVKAKLDFVNVKKGFQNVNEHFGMQKAGEFSPSWTILCRQFRAAAYVQLEFGESAASIRVRLLYLTLR